MSRSYISSSGVSTCGSSAMSAHGSPRGFHPVGHRQRGERLGIDVVELVPLERRRHLGRGPGSDRPRAEHGLVRSVLVEVDEDAIAALFLPPRVGDRVGSPAGQLAGHRDRGAAHLDRRPARLQPGVHVDAAVAGGLGPPADAQLVEQTLQFAGRVAHLVEPETRLGVEVDAELVGVVVVAREVGPHVEPEAPEVHRPHDVREVGRDQRLRRGAVGRAHDRRLQPVGSFLGHALLEEVGAVDAAREALHQHRPTPDRGHERLPRRGGSSRRRRAW